MIMLLAGEYSHDETLLKRLRQRVESPCQGKRFEYCRFLRDALLSMARSVVLFLL